MTALRLQGKTIVIDPGVKRWKKKLLAVFSKIDEVWISHAHPDHAALSKTLQIEMGCSVLSSVQAAEIIENPSSFMPGEFRAAGKLKGDIFPGFLRPFSWPVLSFAYGSWTAAMVDETFAPEGTKRFGVEIRSLPGHTDGSSCFFLFDEGRRTLIIGDLFQQRAFGEYVMSLNLPRADLDKALDSLRRMKSWKPDVIVSAHGLVMEGADSNSGAIDEAIVKYERYRDDVLAFVRGREKLPSLARIARDVPFDWPASYSPGFTHKRSLVFVVLKSLSKTGRLPAHLAARLPDFTNEGG